MITRERIQRALLAAKKLAESTDHLNHALSTLEDIFREKFGDRIEARVVIVRVGRERRIPEVWHTLVFTNGLFFVERRSPNRISLVPLLHTSRETRVAAADRMAALYTACGGVLP